MVQAIWLFNLALLVNARQSLGFTSTSGYVGADLGVVKQGPSKSRLHPRTAPHPSKHPEKRHWPMLIVLRWATNGCCTCGVSEGSCISTASASASHDDTPLCTGKCTAIYPSTTTRDPPRGEDGPFACSLCLASWYQTVWRLAMREARRTSPSVQPRPPAAIVRKASLLNIIPSTICLCHCSFHRVSAEWGVVYILSCTKHP